MFVICHYGEIGLKGKNRKFFEETLVKNIKLALEPADFEYVKRISGRIVVKLTPAAAAGRGAENIRQKIKQALTKVFGIVYFAFAEICEQDIDAIKNKSLEILQLRRRGRSGKAKSLFKTFKIETKRSAKNFPLTSQETNEKVGEFILNKFKIQKAKGKIAPKESLGGPTGRASQNAKSGIKVKLKNPDITVFIELVEKYGFIYTEKLPGPGGLPAGVSGRGVSLLSGGIDSPVASELVMKRGLKLVFAHFHALPFTSEASIEKVKKLVKILNSFQPKTRLYLIPFAHIQKEILLKTPAKLRVVLYRRMMFRISQQIAKKEKSKALVTGESLGQVASQTIENIAVIEKATSLLVLRPLLGKDKTEIIEMAKELGTYNISIQPYEDCCSRFLPQHPETGAKLKEVKNAEEKIALSTLVKQALKSAEKINF